MKLHNLLIAGISTVVLATSTSATTTYQFSQTAVARATGFSDNLGTAGVDGMRWGLIIDTAGNGFQSGSYDLFDSSNSGFLTKLTVATDDYYWTAPSLPKTSTLTATGTDPGGSGGIIAAANAPNGTDGSIVGVTTGDPFAIIWFVTTPNAASTYYGVMEDAAFTLPASGVAVSFASVFSGNVADPIKPANFQFIPEPTTLLLFGLGLTGLLVRRRR